MIVAADEHRAAAQFTRNVDHRALNQRNARRKQQYHAARTISASSIDQTRREQRAFTRLHAHFAARASAREDLARDIERNVGLRGDIDTAAGAIDTADVYRSLADHCALIRLHDDRAACCAARLQRAAGVERHARAALHRHCAAPLPAARAQQRTGSESNRQPSHRNLARASGRRIGRDLRRYRYVAGCRGQRHLAALGAVGRNARRRRHTHALLRGDADGSALALRGVCLDGTGYAYRTGVRLNRNLACRRPGRGYAAPRVESDVFGGLEQNLAVFPNYHGVGLDHAAIADQAGVNADLAAVGNDLAYVHRSGVRRSDLDAQVRRARIHDFDRAAGCQNHLALRAGDDARVLYVRRDQVDLPAGWRRDCALVVDGAGTRRIGEA